MFIDEIEIFHLRLKLVEPFVTAFGRVEERDTLLIRGVSGSHVSWGEAPVLAAPWYTYETVESARHVLAEFICPAIVGRDFESVDDALLSLERIRGNNSARAAIDGLLYHLASLENDVPLSQLIGGVRSEVECGISLGIYSDAAVLLARVERALSDGYRRVKLKIQPGADIAPLSAVRREFPDIRLTVDANGSYTSQDVTYLKRLDSFNLSLIEQPFGYEDLVTHAELQQAMETDICLDESVASLADLESAIALGACRSVNVKLSRIGGLSVARQFNDRARSVGVSLWCGGVFESAIGQADALALGSLSEFTSPADIGPSDRYFVRDVIRTFAELNHGSMLVPTTPGVGFEVDEDFVRSSAVSVHRISGSSDGFGNGS